MEALLLLPTYNEAENLEAITHAILRAVPELRILVIDDNSPDGTGRIADQLAADPSLRLNVMHRPQKEGLGIAYLAGFAEALKRPVDAILQMDADFSHPVELLPQLLRALDQHDFALGSRYVKGGGTQGWNFKRRMLSRGANFYARQVLGLPIRDLTGGFKAFRRQVVEYLLRCPIAAKGYQFQIETTARALAAGFRCQEVPFIFPERQRGTSKMSGNLIGEAIWQTLRLRKICRGDALKMPRQVNDRDRYLNTAEDKK